MYIDKDPTIQLAELSEATEAYKSDTFRTELGRPALREVVALTGESTKPVYIAGTERFKIYKYIMDSNQPPLTKELIDDDDARFIPTSRVEVDGKEFLFSPALDMNNYKVSVGYSLDEDGRFLPRLFYKSKSSSGWRASQGYAPSGFMKGSIGSAGSYVQLTKPIQAVESALRSQEDSAAGKQVTHQELLKYFNPMRQSSKGEQVDTFEDEIKVKHPLAHSKAHERALYETYSPGVGFLSEPESARQRISSPELTPEGFTPDFTQEPVSIRSYDDELAGHVEVSVYNHNHYGTRYEWHVARDEEGNVWLDRIQLLQAQATSYGTMNEVVVAGALSAKPFEYKDQVNGMEPGFDYDELPGKYVDLRQKYWGRMDWVKKYKQIQLSKNTA